MPTDFRNRLLYPPDTSTGIITTITDLKVWDCYRKEWTESPLVIIRNAMLFAMYHARDFCIGEISPAEEDSFTLNPFIAPGKTASYRLDLASNSRNHGRFTFINGNTIGQNYYGTAEVDQWKRIIYGSIVHTGCKAMAYKVIKYVIVDDELRDEDGNYRDDPTNNYHWQTGDSHAKACASLMELIGLPTNKETPEPGDIVNVDVEKPVQFRAAEYGKWVAKGTIGYNPDLDGSPFDLVIPVSCLKGNKPIYGNYEGKILIGTVFEAEIRRAKAGWMLFQWFDYRTLQQDLIISKLMQKIGRSLQFNQRPGRNIEN
jgi:hypothetical protein